MEKQRPIPEQVQFEENTDLTDDAPHRYQKDQKS